MADPKKDPEPTDAAKSKFKPTLSVNDICKLVRRQVAKRDEKGNVVKDKDGNPVSIPVAIKASDVMVGSDGKTAAVEYEDKVVVVLKNGEKLEAPKN